jgi:dihydroneopterin aldolase
LLQIHLKNVQFFAYHGIYAEERKLGNYFEVNIDIWHQPNALPVLHMKDTIDYVRVYELVKQRMAKPTPLLETVVTEIAQSVLAEFKLATKIVISIDKLCPPILSFEGKVGVSFTLERN